MRFVPLLILMVLAPALLRADTAGDWAKANAFYQQKNYDSAAVYYEKVAAGKPRQAAVFYNLGNTYYRLNRIGIAVLNYEKALKRDPGMSEACDNRQLAQSRISNHINSGGDVFFVRWWKSGTHPAYTTAWSVTALLLFITTLVLASLRLFGNKTGIRSKLIAASALLFAVSLIFVFVSAGRHDGQSAVVLNDAVPLTGAANAIKPLALVPEGTVVQIQTNSRGQMLVTLPDGRSGWIEASALGLVD